MTKSSSTNRSTINQSWDLLTKLDSSIVTIKSQNLVRLSTTLAIVFVILNLIGSIFTTQHSLGNRIQIFGIPGFIFLISFLIMRTHFHKFGKYILICALCASCYFQITNNIIDNRIGILFFIPVTLTIASVLLTSWELFLLAGLNISMIFLVTYGNMLFLKNDGIDLIIIALFSFLLLLIKYYQNNAEVSQLSELHKVYQETSNVRDNLEKLIEQKTYDLNRRATRLEFAAFVARTAAETQDLSDLLNISTRIIGQNFGYYHVGIFLADEQNSYLKLASASSKNGKLLVQNGHRLRIGLEGIVGTAAYQKRSRVAQSVGSDAAFSKNPELPLTHSEAALPLLAHDILVGILDIQSEEENAFTSEDIFALQAIANQIALSIENIRLVQQSQTALKNLEFENIKNSTKAWRTRLENQIIGFSYTANGIQPISSQDLILDNHSTDGQATINIPIELRGKKIGAISLIRKSKDSNWSDKEKELTGQIASQVALAIENARLLEESQNQVVREQTITEFSNRFNESLDLETLLKSSVKEISRIPNVSEVSLLINPIPQPQNLGGSQKL